MPLLIGLPDGARQLEVGRNIQSAKPYQDRTP